MKRDLKLHTLVTLVLIALSLTLVGCGGEATPATTSTPSPSSTLAETPRIDTAATQVAPKSSAFRLTILHNNDGQSQLIDLGPGLEDFGGVARFKTVVQREKQVVVSDEGPAGKRGVIMVSSGDNFVAGAEFIAGLRAGIFYDALALDLIGYDAIALGNHDFDFGPEVLAEFIKQVSTSRAPFLSSNLDYSGEPMLRDLFDQGRIAESVVVEENGESIGIIGATTPDLGVISSPRKVKIIDDVAGEVQTEVDRLEASGVNKIVLISHLQDIDTDIALVGQLQGVDVVVAGGGDELLANEGDLLIPGEGTPFGPYPIMATDRGGNRVPVVTTAGSYSYLGKLVVTFDGNGRLVDIDEAASGPLRIAGGDDRFLWQARRLALDYGAALPGVAVQNSGAIRNDSLLPAGQIRELDTLEMAPFANMVAVVEEISRSQFKEVLENAVSRAVGGDTEGGTGRFAQVSGFSFEWSESGIAQVLNPDGSVKVPGTRVQTAVLDGGEVIVRAGRVASGLELTVATTDFLARGGDEYPFRGAPFTALGVTYQQALVNYIQFPAGLDGTVTAADYRDGGEGRIKRLP